MATYVVWALGPALLVLAGMPVVSRIESRSAGAVGPDAFWGRARPKPCVFRVDSESLGIPDKTCSPSAWTRTAGRRCGAVQAPAAQ